jgi:hypothetical protein
MPAGLRALAALATFQEGDTSASRTMLEETAEELRRKLARSTAGLPNFEAGLLSGVHAQTGQPDSSLTWLERLAPGQRRFYAVQFARHWFWEPVR